MSTLQPSHGDAGWSRKAAIVLALLAVLGATALALVYAGQPLLDRHAFRQTQTAVTAYWFLREGYRFAYETPVAGYPWVMPFEFPLYQTIVAAIAQISGLSLSLVGRLVSFAFLLLCIPAAGSITRRLGLPSAVLVIFVALTFTTPIYVYWGRAFLIETSALFFGLLAIKFALDDLLGGRSAWRLLGFCVFMVLCMLQKATTGLPILMVFALLFALAEIGQPAAPPGSRLRRWAMLGLVIFLPLAAGYAWTSFADAVKQASLLGPALTSSALSAWNWGTAAQRVSSGLWQDVILTRILIFNFGGIMGAGLVIAALVVKAERRIKAVIAVALVLGLLPLFMFTNLHMVHDYYQSSNMMFLIYALAVALGAVIAPRVGGRAGLAFLAALMVANLYALVQTGYLAAMRQTFSLADRDVAVSHVLAHELPADSQFVAFGNDYSATLAYLSERKSFTVPGWFKDLEQVIARPGDYVEKGHLGAVVACSEQPDAWRLMDWSAAQGDWKVGEVAGCAIAVPGLQPPGAPRPGQCRGLIERASLLTHGPQRAIELSGWAATGDEPARAADAVFVAMRGPGGSSLFVDTLPVPRPDLTRSLGPGAAADVGFSRLLPASLPAGTYSLAIVQRVDGQDIACAPSADLVIP